MKIHLEGNLACVNLIIGVIGIIFFLLIPLLSHCESCNFGGLDHSSLASSISAIEVRTSGVALFTAGCPMVIDLIMDLLSGSDFTSIKSETCWIGRAIIGIITILVGLHIALGYDFFNLPYGYITSFRFAFSCLRIGYITPFMFCLCTVNPKIFTPIQTSSFSFLTVALFIIKFYGPTSTSLVIFNANIVITYIWLIYAFILIVFWIFKLWKQRAIWTVDDYTCAFYVFLLILTVGSVYSSIIFQFLGSSGTVNVKDSKIINLAVPICLQTACAVFMSIIPGRIARIEAIVSKDRVIETKQAYVRYISHELRTPLNTVYMGLQLSIDQIPADSINPVERERRSTLQEVWCACEVALDILNDLLLYDKLQLHSVALSKEKLSVIDFMTQCINMFTVQLRLKKLHLILICTNLTNTDYQYDNNHTYIQQQHVSMNDKTQDNSFLTREDTIDADKSKLSQVIRNLLSNAIKFTPEGGDIQVSISFVPNKSIKEEESILFHRKSLGKAHRYVNSFVERLSLYCHQHFIFSSSSTSTSKAVIHLEELQQSKQDANQNKSNDAPVVYDIEHGVHDNYQVESIVVHNTTSRKTIGENSVLALPISSSSYPLKLEHQTSRSCYSSIDGMLVIEVKDSGVGINIDDQQQLFKEIIQFKPEVLQGGGGSGLGLFITKGIVDLHGGQISVHSEGEGKGTTIRLELPMTRSSIITPASNEPISSKMSSSSSSASSSHGIYPDDHDDIPLSTASTSKSTSILSEWNFKNDGFSTYRSLELNESDAIAKFYAEEIKNNIPSSNSTNTVNSMIIRNQCIYFTPPLNRGYHRIHDKEEEQEEVEELYDISYTNNTHTADYKENENSSSSSSSSTVVPFQQPQQQHLQQQQKGEDVNEMKIEYVVDKVMLDDSISDPDHPSPHPQSRYNKEEKREEEEKKKEQEEMVTLTTVPSEVFNEDNNDDDDNNALSRRTTTTTTTTTNITNMEALEKNNHHQPHQQQPQQQGLENEDTKVFTSHSSNSNCNSHLVINRISSSNSNNSTVTEMIQANGLIHNIEDIASTVPEITESKLSSLKLLVVDDSGLNRKMMRRLLEAQGHVCEEAADGLIAVNMVKAVMMNNSNNNMITDQNSTTTSTTTSNTAAEDDIELETRRLSRTSSTSSIHGFDHYDAILMDFVMPVMNGPTATTEIRKLGYPGPIMGVTGNVLASDRDIFIAAGASHFFTKPLDVSLVTKAFRECGML